MESELVMGYMVFVDDKFAAVGKSLDEARQLGEGYIGTAKKLMIKSAVAPAPTQTWIYDPSVMKWVEQI